jgi:hypothetical protein
VHLFAKAFWLQKAGNAAEEYEDAFWPKHLLEPHEANVSEFRVAVADGATETSFAGLWAKLLVRSYVEARLTPEAFATSLLRLQGRWRKVVSQKPLPWYAEENVQRGAAAAILGLHLRSRAAGSSEGSWNAIALGDCCVIQVRGGHVIERFPLKSASEFSNSPFLVSSNPSASEGWQEHLKTVSGSWISDDSFYVMSDAIAAWFMRDDEVGSAPWELLRDLGTPGSPHFSDWIGDVRSARTMRNDDVTLVRIDLVG